MRSAPRHHPPLLALVALAAACGRLPTLPADAGLDAPPDAGCERPGCAPRVVQLAAGRDHACALTAEGEVYCWGSNERGQLGAHVLEIARGSPVRVPGLRARAVAAGGASTCALTAEGAALCWGANDPGQGAPAGPRALDLPPGAAALGLRDGGGCALYPDGSLACWPSTAAERFARHPELTDVAALASGAAHWCARRGDGAVWCSGDGAAGQLGYRPPAGADTRATAAAVPGVAPARAVAAALATTCALADDGTVRCWGDNTFGQAGTGGADAVVWSPAPVAGLAGVSALFATGSGFFARVPDGGLRAWGYNRRGQLGDGTLDTRLTPAPALGAIAADVVELVGGASFGCARLRDDTVRCWGGNVRGELGRGGLGGASTEPAAPAW